MDTTVKTILMGTALSLCGVMNLHAASDQAAQKKEEDRIAANEEEEDAKIPINQQKSAQLEGVLTLLDSEKPSPFGVVGFIETTDGKKLGIKLGDTMKVELLKPYHEKKVQLEGRLRVNGKYLVVLRVVTMTIPPKRELPSRPGL